jgi:DNA-binding NtrC family response regulator
MANILVVDDELGIRDLLSEILNDEGHNVELAENAAQARAARSAPGPTWCCWTSGCPTPTA